MNGYFQLEVKAKGVYMHFMPPTDKGAAFRMEDAIAYLESHNITGYNTIEMKRALESRVKTELFISSAKLPVSGEEIFLKISDDKMRATVKFYPPFKNGRVLDQKDIEASLEAAGITMGIKEDVIRGFLTDRQYCQEIVIAEGEEPVQGVDAQIIYHFDTDLRAKPQLKEDGSVDFHQLNSISHVKKGEVLASLTPEKRGKKGYNVIGEWVDPREPKKKKLSYGKNISLTKDKLSIVSEVDGHVNLVDDKVFVSDVYEIVTDVDAGTGDIEYNGNIEVKGNVRSGFTLKANGDISVNGVVEGAILIAQGDIILRCGIQGKGKGELSAGGNIVTKFIENAVVNAGANITTEAILHSRVNAKDSILVTGKKGFVTGGKVSALSLIEAKTIGSSMGADTVISVGTNPEDKEKEHQLQIEMDELRREIVRLEPVVTKMTTSLAAGERFAPDKLAQMRVLVGKYRQCKKKYEENESMIMQLLENEKVEKTARIRVKGKIYPGVKIVISDSMYVIKETAQYCQFQKKGIDIKMSGL